MARLSHNEFILRLGGVLLFIILITLYGALTRPITPSAWIGIPIGVFFVVLSVTHSLSTWDFKENARKDGKINEVTPRGLFWVPIGVVLLNLLTRLFLSEEVKDVLAIAGLTWAIPLLSIMIGLTWWHRPKGGRSR